jgi:hypothetical protein
MNTMSDCRNEMLTYVLTLYGSGLNLLPYRL